MMMLGNKLSAGSLVLLSLVTIDGCLSADEQKKVPNDVEVLQEINRLRGVVQAMPPELDDAALHALVSTDSVVRAEAATSIGKSRSVKQAVLQQLEHIAINDPDPIARGAAIAAIFDLDKPTPRILELTDRLQADPQLGALVTALTDAH